MQRKGKESRKNIGRRVESPFLLLFMMRAPSPPSSQHQKKAEGGTLTIEERNSPLILYEIKNLWFLFLNWRGVGVLFGATNLGE